MKSLIIGAGEVGSSLKKVIEPYHETYIRDINPIEIENVQVLHVCYPDHEGFVETTKKYIQEYKPALTIINSSTEVGTTRKCGDKVVYSPIRGRHPENGLDKEMKVYPKFVSAVNSAFTGLASSYFEACGWRVYRAKNPEDLEYLKLMSNIHMGLEVAWRQEIERMMKHFAIDKKTYEKWEETYTQGYIELNQTHLIRSRMKPDPIGGHCIIPCTLILKDQFPSKAFDFILESNEKTKTSNK